MAIGVGERIPSVTLKRLTENGMQEVSTDELFNGRKVVVFGLPGAFTPTCSAKHLPGFIERADEFKAKGVDEIFCMSVNDPFVMRAWGDQQGADGKVTMLPDGNATLTKQLGLELDATGYGLGQRCVRFAMIVEDGVVRRIDVEKPGQFEVSSAESVLKAL